MTNREIKKILERAEKVIEKDYDKNCDNDCKKCKYNIGDISCKLVHLLCWLSDHNDILEKFKSYKKDNKERENEE